MTENKQISNEKSQIKRVAVGMSGGVDSSVTASLLLEQGYEVTGVYIEAYNEPGCRADEDKRDALKVATQLGIKFEVLDLRQEYKKRVIKYFFDEYKAGRTPNPDIVCNAQVKFGLFYEWALKSGYERVATGHYCRIAEISKIPIQNSEFRLSDINSNEEQYLLKRPKDLSKDQSYFLWEVEQERLRQILFPLGTMLKSEVREYAKTHNFPNADKPDSMGVCMMGELNVHDFLKEKLGENPGLVMYKKFRTPRSSELIEIGTHSGMWFYTIGSRGGWSINNKSQITNVKLNTANLPPLYVIEKDVENNQLIVGERKFVDKQIFGISNIEYRISEEQFDHYVDEGKIRVRIRNLGELITVSQCHSVKSSHNSDKPGWVVETRDRVFAPAPGQSAVFYVDDMVVAGGLIV